MHPSGAIGAALEVVAVDVVKDRAGNAAGGGIGADVEGIWGTVAAWLVCGLIMMLSVWFSLVLITPPSCHVGLGYYLGVTYSLLYKDTRPRR